MQRYFRIVERLTLQPHMGQHNRAKVLNPVYTTDHIHAGLEVQTKFLPILTNNESNMLVLFSPTCSPTISIVDGPLNAHIQ